MSQSRSLELQCTGNTVSLDILKQYIEELLLVDDETLPERTCVHFLSQSSGYRSVPLCQGDVLAAAGRVDLRDLYERLAKLVDDRGRRRTASQTTNRLVRELLTLSNSALASCTALMKMLGETGFKEGHRDLDNNARREIDNLSSLLDEVAERYGAAPLLLMAALVEGGFSGIVTAMLQGRSIEELTRRGGLFYQVLLLIRMATRLPDVAMLLVAPTRHHGNPVSVLGSLNALASVCRTMSEWDPGRWVQQRPQFVAVAETLEKQRKMAIKVMDTQKSLQAVVNMHSGKSLATIISSAVATPSAEADRLTRMVQELQATAGEGPAAAAHQASPLLSSYNAPVSHHQSGSVSYSGTGNNYYMPSDTYDARHTPTTSSNSNTYTAYGIKGGMYGISHGIARGTYDSDSAPSAPPLEDVYGISASGLTSNTSGAYSQAVQYTAETLRQQRELQRLTQAPTVGGPYQREGLVYQSQPELLTSAYEPMATSTMSYPRRMQTLEPGAAATSTGRESLHSRPQQQQQQQQYAYYPYENIAGSGTVPSGPGGAAAAWEGVNAAAVRLQRGYSVPSTPQRASAPPLTSHQQLLQLQQQEQRQHELMRQLETLSEHLQQLSTPTANGRYLGGYSAGAGNGSFTSAAAADASQAAASRPRSTVRQRMPSADSSVYSSHGASDGSGWASGSILGTNTINTAASVGVGGLRYNLAADGSLPTRQQAWAAPQSLQTSPQYAVQGWQQQQQLQQQHMAAATRPTAAQESGQYVDAAKAAVERSVVGSGAAAFAEAARQPSTSLSRALSTDSASVYSSPGMSASGRVVTAWASVPIEAARTPSQPQQQPQSRSDNIAPSMPTMAEASQPASIRPDATRASKPQRQRACSPSSCSSGSSTGGSGGGGSRRRNGSTGGGGTLRAIAAKHGLIPGLSRSPRQHHDQYMHSPIPAPAPAPAPAATPYEVHQSRTSSLVPRTSQNTPTSTVPAPPSSSLLDRYQAYYDRHQSAEGDPRVGGNDYTGTAPKSSSVLLDEYGMVNTSSHLGRVGSLTAPETEAATAVADRNALRYAPATGSAGADITSRIAAHSCNDGGSTAAAATVDNAVAGTCAAAGSSAGVHPSSSTVYKRSAREVSTAASNAAVSSPQDLPHGYNSSGGGGGVGSSTGGYGGVVQRQSGSPHCRTGGNSAAPSQMEAPNSSTPSPQVARPTVDGPRQKISTGSRSGGKGTTAAVAAAVSPEDLEVLRGSAATGVADARATGSNLSSRRRLATQQRLQYSSSSSVDTYDDDDGELQYALQLSRQEAEAAATTTRSRSASAVAADTASVSAVPKAAVSAAATRTAVERSSLSGNRNDRRPPQLPPPAPAPSPPASPQRQQADALVTATSCIDENGGGGMLVGGAVLLAVLHQRYAELNPLLSAKLVSLEDDFPLTRRVAGDGNCFYRAALFAILENVMTRPDEVLCEQLEAVVKACLRRLELLQDAPQAAGDGGGGGSWCRAATPERSLRGDGSVSATASPASGETGGGSAAGSVDPLAVRGGKRLLRLLKTAWFKAMGAAEPSDVSSLETLFNDSAQSAEVIRFARSLTVHELVSDEAFYAPFIPGCGRDYSGLSLHQICVHHVLPMGVEVEQLQIIALCRALGTTLAVLDVAGSQVGAIKHGPKGHCGPPVAWVAHLPGHYDVVYPARPLDVAPGGMLVPA